MLEEAVVQCPYCWEPLDILLNPDDEGCSYIEDCQVCCRPIEMRVSRGENDELTVQAHHEDE